MTKEPKPETRLQFLKRQLDDAMHTITGERQVYEGMVRQREEKIALLRKERDDAFAEVEKLRAPAAELRRQAEKIDEQTRNMKLWTERSEGEGEKETHTGAPPAAFLWLRPTSSLLW